MTVIFDLDGTLLDTPSGIVDVVRLTALELGVENPSEDSIRSVIGKPLTHMFGFFSWSETATKRAIPLFRQLFSEQVVSTASDLAFPGIEEALESLAARHTIAVATSKVVSSAEEILSASGLLKYFGVVAGADSVENPKPHPDMALFVAYRLGVTPVDCTVVGDSVYDMGMAASAGMRAVGVTWGIDSPEELSAAGATTICRDPNDLLDSLTSYQFSAKEV